MIYETIRYPEHLSLNNFVLQHGNISEYLDWFHSIKEERLKYFCSQVFNSERIELSKSKLQAVYYFFTNNLTLKDRSEDEIEIEKSKLPDQIREIHEVPNFEIIEPTHSLIFDASIYFGELIVAQVPGVSWSIESDSAMANYGTPVLVKEKVDVDLNPSAVFYSIIRQLKKGVIEEDKLLVAFEKGKDKLNGQQPDFLAMVNSWGKK